jgi:hypothetical protein
MAKWSYIYLLQYVLIIIDLIGDIFLGITQYNKTLTMHAHSSI